MTTVRRAFTLVEILVTVSIISVLVGILLPVLSAARERARASTCLSNLRQIGQALQIYVADNEGTYPPTLGGSSLWIQKLELYTGHRGPLGCPDRQLPALYDAQREGFPLVGYAYNERLNSFTTLGRATGKLETRLVNPASTVVAFDARAGVFSLTRPDMGDPELNSSSILLGNPPGIREQIKALPDGGRRHQEGGHYVCADGHAVWRRPEQVGVAETSEGRGIGFGL